MLDLSNIIFTNLSTLRLELKSITNEHAQDVLELRSDENVMKYIGKPKAKTLDDALELIQKMKDTFENKTGISWGIFFKGENKLIGIVGFWRIDAANYRTEIGYLLNSKYWRNGIVLEVVECLLNYGFNILKFHSIEAKADPKNIASTALMRKAGFIQEAHIKENYFFEGEFSDTVIYSMLKSDFNLK
jgi:ribosomal-protein-alanine N-acetyltransferase